MHFVVDDLQTRSHSMTFPLLIWDGTCTLVGLFPVVEVVASEKGGVCCLLQQSFGSWSTIVEFRTDCKMHVFRSCLGVFICNVHFFC